MKTNKMKTIPDMKLMDRTNPMIKPILKKNDMLQIKNFLFRDISLSPLKF